MSEKVHNPIENSPIPQKKPAEFFIVVLTNKLP